MEGVLNTLGRLREELRMRLAECQGTTRRSRGAGPQLSQLTDDDIVVVRAKSRLASSERALRDFREEVAKVNRAATRVQSTVRGSLARRRAQAAVRRRHLRAERALTALQLRFRRWLDDREYARQAEKRLAEIAAARHRAATKVQSAMRRRMVRGWFTADGGGRDTLLAARDRRRVTADLGVSPRSLVRQKVAAFAVRFRHQMHSSAAKAAERLEAIEKQKKLEAKLEQEEAAARAEAAEAASKLKKEEAARAAALAKAKAEEDKRAAVAAADAKAKKAKEAKEAKEAAAAAAKAKADAKAKAEAEAAAKAKANEAAEEARGNQPKTAVSQPSANPAARTQASKTAKYTTNTAADTKPSATSSSSTQEGRGSRPQRAGAPARTSGTRAHVPAPGVRTLQQLRIGSGHVGATSPPSRVVKTKQVRPHCLRIARGGVIVANAHLADGSVFVVCPRAGAVVLELRLYGKERQLLPAVWTSAGRDVRGGGFAAVWGSVPEQQPTAAEAGVGDAVGHEARSGCRSVRCFLAVVVGTVVVVGGGAARWTEDAQWYSLGQHGRPRVFDAADIHHNQTAQLF